MEQFQFGFCNNNNFGLSQDDTPIFSHSQNFVFHTPVFIEKELTLQENSYFKVRGEKQWITFYEENFSNFNVSNWKTNQKNSQEPKIQKCGSVTLLGGYCELSKQKLTFAFPFELQKLQNFETIKLRVGFHFIDSWTGQSAFLKVNDHILWTDSYDYT